MRHSKNTLGVCILWGKNTWGRGVTLRAPIRPIQPPAGETGARRVTPLPRLASVLFLLCILFFLFPVAHASAHGMVSGNGHISGQLLDGSQKNRPLVGQTVTLQMAQDGSAHDQATSTTDAHGMYTFTNLATDKAISYALYINYQGAQYTSNIVTLASKPVQQMNLTVYDATLDTSNIAIVSSTVLIKQPDAKSSTFTVSELFDFKNLGIQAFVGSLDASQGKPQALFFSLPKDARSVNLEQGFTGYKAQQEPNGFATNAVVYPGDTAFSLSFDVPYLSSVYDFNYEAMYPTVSLSFLVDPSIHASAGALSSQGIVTAQQHTYHLFTGNELLASQDVHVNFEGLLHDANSPAPLDLKTIWLIVGLIILMAIIVVSSVLYRLKDNQKHPKNKKHTSKNTYTGHAHKKPIVVSTSTDRREALMHEMLELDEAFEAGKLTKAVYQERRTKIKANLRTLMSEREASKK